MWRQDTAIVICLAFKDTADCRCTHNRPVHSWLDLHDLVTHIKHLHRRHIGAFMHFGPDTVAVGKYLAFAKHGAAARPIAHLLGTRLRADERGGAKHTLATAMASKYALLTPLFNAEQYTVQAASGPDAIKHSGSPTYSYESNLLASKFEGGADRSQGTARRASGTTEASAMQLSRDPQRKLALILSSAALPGQRSFSVNAFSGFDVVFKN